LQLFCKPLVWALACGGLEMCCNVGGVSFFAWGEKNKINSSKFAPTCQRAKYFNLLVLNYTYQSWKFSFFALLLTENCKLRKGLRAILCPHTDERMSGKPLLAYH
jgi:hypothetical protein